MRRASSPRWYAHTDRSSVTSSRYPLERERESHISCSIFSSATGRRAGYTTTRRGGSKAKVRVDTTMPNPSPERMRAAGMAWMPRCFAVHWSEKRRVCFHFSRVKE